MDTVHESDSAAPGWTRRQVLQAGAGSAATVAALASLSAQADNAAPLPAAARQAVVNWQQQPFALGQVSLLDGPFLQAQQRNRRFLMSLPNERLLHSFRLTAGLPSSAEPFGGWESPHCEIRGHFSGGHYLSACALLYASTGDEELKRKADALVDGLAQCQAADGYLGAYPTEFYDRLAVGKEVWVPIYTLHKIIAGHLDMARHCGNAQALRTATRLADWLGAWMDQFDDARWQNILKVEFGGVHESLLELYLLTGKQDYQRWAARYDQPSLLQPLRERRDALEGLHANTQIPKIIASARAYEVSGDVAQRGLAEYFWQQVVDHHSYCTGGVSDYEHFGRPDHLAGRLSGHSHECCCSYNMLKLTRHLHGWQPDARYMDYYERVLFNARLGTQDASGMMMYFVPMDAGYWKLFNTPDASFWCCTGTGAEEFAKTQDTIYFHDRDGLSVNLYIASQLDWPERGLRLTQHTRFPDEQGSSLRFELRSPQQLELRLRIPAWSSGARLYVNGKQQSLPLEPGSYARLKRRFVDGDEVRLELPMALHAAALPDEPSLQAMMYGPLVLAARMGTAGIPASQLHVSDQRPSLNRIHGQQLPTAYQQGTEPWAVAKPGQELVFEAEGIDGPLQLVPFYRVLHERYSVHIRVRPRWEKLPQF